MAECLRSIEIMGLRKPLGVCVDQAVADLPAGILQGARQAVVGARPAEGQQMRAGLGDAEGFGGPAVVPVLHRLRVSSPVLNAGTGIRIATVPILKPATLCRRVTNDCAIKPVPLLPHELQPIRRIGHDGVEAVRLHAGHDGHAVTVVDHSAAIPPRCARQAMIQPMASPLVTCAGVTRRMRHPMVVAVLYFSQS